MARTDREFIVDGRIVDLNQITLPSDTPIMDKRFGAEHKVDAGEGE